MTRWAAGLEYLGTAYSGWQAQTDRPSVQAQVEAALSAVADHPVRTQAAGRTDAGVHAAGQVVHFDSAAPRSAYAWVLGANSRLPRDIGLRWIREVPARFDARRSAVARRYRYLIHNHRSRSALAMNRAAWITHELDAGAMHRAAQVLIGEHDFSAFRAAECQSSTPMREVQEVSVKRHGEYVVLDIRANAFLHHMVRNIAGALIAVGQGRQREAWIAELLAARDRTRAAATAPACGLYFLGPVYPAAFGLPPPVESWLP
ncbi:MAG: tRNA pseudouridine(38-40) synthase TruA [Nevskia sp.]|nr:tRNA pseudouridine(38-40) synthase TruA [Nevskia sp.]